jgi:hypothetical protein
LTLSNTSLFLTWSVSHYCYHLYLG